MPAKKNQRQPLVAPRLRVLAVSAAVAATFMVTGGANAAANTAAEQVSREPVSVIALPVPAHAIGADLTAAHTGSTYLGNAVYPNHTSHPVLWHRTGFSTFTVRELGLPPGMTFGWCSGSNASGAITVSDSGPTTDLAFVLFHGRTYALSDLAGGHAADVYGITASGTTYGDALDAYGNWVAVRWDRWTSKPVKLQLPPGMFYSTAVGGNDRGELVGNALNYKVLEAVTWSPDGHVTVLPQPERSAPFSQAFTISHAGRAVGESTWPPNGDDHATAWPGKGNPVDLRALPGDVTARIFEGSPDGRADGASFNAGRTVARVAYWPGHGPLETLAPFGNPASGSSGHGVSDDGEVQGATIPNLAIAPVGDIPTLWTDADRQAFVPVAPSPAVQSTRAPAAGTRTQLNPQIFGDLNSPAPHEMRR